MEWLPVFTRQETVDILRETWRYQRQHGLKLYGYVILENHCHFIAQAERLDKCVSSFKSFTARKIIDYLHSRRVEMLLSRLHAAKKHHKHDRQYQFW